ncbi:MAG: PAS domain S-box protein [Alphaproteobacteria bacterium]|nr:PAS domain S-box protein [Alphaproteobacteria bacterium]MCW5741332.1 PAS domain S-box protein [Alphaproteobacteria bacterium]
MSAAVALWRQRREYLGAIGRKGALLAAVAGLLLLLAFAAAVATVQSLSRPAKPYESVTAELAQLLTEVGGSGMALLAAIATIDGVGRMDEARERWQMASARIGQFCDGRDRADGVPRIYLCDRLLGARASIDRDLLRTYPLSAADIDRVATELTRLVDFLRAYGRAHREQAAEAQAAIGEQRSLMVMLVIGTGGAMAASFVLFYVVAGAATANRNGRLAAERSEKAAIETRQQLMEAIEAIPVGFGLYDRDGRMVMFNERLAALSPQSYTPDIVGLHFEEIIDRHMACRQTDEEERRRVGDRLRARFRSQQPGDLQWMPGGRYFESNEIHTPSGYIASCRVDITALKQREAELEASEARYRQVVDSMIDAVFTSGSDGLTYVSGAAQPVLGMPAGEAIGLKPADMFHAEDMPRMLDCLRALRRDPGSVQTVRLRTGGRLASGRWIEMRFTASGPADSRGHYPLIGVLRDIDAQVQLEQAQRDDMMKMRSIVESSGALIALVDGEQRVVLANRTFLDAAGRTLGQVIGRRYEEVVDCGDAAPALAAWLAGEQRETFAFDQVIRSGGRRRVVRVSASHVHDVDGRVNYSLLLGVDETERRQAETRAIDASRLATLGEMATGMAHEINQPLTVVQFAVDAIEADLEDNLHRDDPETYVAEAARHIARVRNQAQRAAGIVRRLQGFARRGDEVAQAFDVAEAIRVGVDLVAEQMRLERIAVALDLPADLPPVHGHATRLQQVVINLMINARDAIVEARAGAEGPVRHERIDIRAAHDMKADRVVIEIADSGSGIPEHVLPRLFESFFTTKPRGKGTGLGLSISTDIVAEMKGAITAENRAQGGALFRLSFPTIERIPAAA